MAGMSAKATPIVVTEDERAELERWLRSPTSEQRLAFRARVVLAAAAGEGSASIARRERVRVNTVSTWRVRFAQQGIAALADQQRAGRPRQYGAEAEHRLLAKLDEPPPEGFSTWNGNLLGQALAIPADQAWRILRRNGIQLQRRRSWCVSTDPEFAPKAAEIVALYLDPPVNAVVLCVDEKPSIQALERVQGYLRLPNGRAIRGQGHEYKRHGTTTLFAALEVATGKVTGMHAPKKRREEFLTFLNQVVAAYPNQELHVVLDNFSTHKPKHDAWLSRHRNVHFHFTPTHASWLNQVEVWFSVLSRAALRASSFSSIQDVCERIDSFIAAYNRFAKPFRWLAKEVHPSVPKRKIAQLRK
jgi:transposase